VALKKAKREAEEQTLELKKATQEAKKAKKESHRTKNSAKKSEKPEIKEVEIPKAQVHVEDISEEEFKNFSDSTGLTQKNSQGMPSTTSADSFVQTKNKGKVDLYTEAAKLAL
jgi:hypothetical protein